MQLDTGDNITKCDVKRKAPQETVVELKNCIHNFDICSRMSYTERQQAIVFLPESAYSISASRRRDGTGLLTEDTFAGKLRA